jgi:pentatricopeptide repeat protein
MKCVWCSSLTRTIRVTLVVLAFSLYPLAFAQTKVQSSHADKSKSATPIVKSSGGSVTPANFKQESEEIMGHCRSLFMQQDYRTAESLLKKELPVVRQYGSNESILPRYLGVLGSCCYFQKRYKDAVTYIREALKTNAALSEKNKITRTALFSNNAYLGLSLQELEQYPKASEHLKKAIELSEGLPAIDHNWLKVCYHGLIYSLRRQGKYEEVLKYKERMSKIK